jgi:hypothetical protein
MTLKELEALIPNGLHDAYLKRLSVNYEARTAVLELDILLGYPEGATEEEREGYAHGEITVSGLRFCIVEAPEYDEAEERALSIDAGPTTPEVIQKYGWKLPPVPPDCFCHWLYVSNWNTFIHIAGRDARLSPGPETFWRHYPRELWPAGLVAKPIQG